MYVFYVILLISRLNIVERTETCAGIYYQCVFVSFIAIYDTGFFFDPTVDFLLFAKVIWISEMRYVIRLYASNKD